MIAADRPARHGARLCAVGRDGAITHHPRAALSSLLEPGDLVVANDAATLPASLLGTHAASGAPIEIRLAAWRSLGDPTRFLAVAFGKGDHRVRTEDRAAPPPIRAGDRLDLGPLHAVVEDVLDHPRLLALRFRGERAAILAGLARHGRPIQYAHVEEPLALWDVWTSIAAQPVAFEAPSAGFALDWRTIAAWRRRGVGFATLALAAGLSSTGTPVLDARLPLDEAFRIPRVTARAIAAARRRGSRVLALGTTVVRALEAAADARGDVRSGNGTATGRIGRGTRLSVVDAILTGMHEPGESHYELLRAFTDDASLLRLSAELEKKGYRGHEFGDSLLLDAAEPAARSVSVPESTGRDAQAVQ